MFRIEELKLGNYLLAENAIRKVGGIYIGSSEPGGKRSEAAGNHQEAYTWMLSEKLRFLPLTEELLAGLGFSFHTHFKLWQRLRPAKSYCIELDSDFVALDFMHRPICGPVQYVHTLQNLFYSIQGAGLTFAADTTEQNIAEIGVRQLYN